MTRVRGQENSNYRSSSRHYSIHLGKDAINMSSVGSGSTVPRSSSRFSQQSYTSNTMS
jgi:hypothetical protein